MSIYADDHADIRDLLTLEGAPFLWRARYSLTNAADYGLDSAPLDLHVPAGVPRCPVCYNTTLQRAASTACTTCYGTGWQGGFAPIQGLQALIAYGTHRLAQEAGGLLLSTDGWWCYSAPDDALLLPQDLLILAANPVVRYLVGEIGNTPGLAGAPAVRVSQVLPLAPDHPLQAVPL